jgi:hypothetical protein
VAIPQVVNGEPANHMATPEQPKTVWPIETDLLFFPGITKALLTLQKPLMHLVIQDSFEQVCKALLFTDAFPDTFVALEFTQESLLAAANCHD